MARQKGPIKIEGTLDDLSFYSSVYGDIVRRKGGASKEKIKKSPAFARLREHHKEFSHCVEAAKLLRYSLRPYTKLAPDFRLVGRMNKLMNDLKNLDKTSPRGKRRIDAGLKTEAGRFLFEGFDLNSQAPLEKILKAEPEVEEDGIALRNFVPKKHLRCPKEATHVIVTGIVSSVDFDAGKYQAKDVSVKVKLDHKKQTVDLRPGKSKKGPVFYLLQLRFLRETKQGSEELKGKSCLTVLMVGF